MNNLIRNLIRNHTVFIAQPPILGFTAEKVCRNLIRFDWILQDSYTYVFYACRSPVAEKAREITHTLQHTAATHCCNTLLQHVTATRCCNALLRHQEHTPYARKIEMQSAATNHCNKLLQHSAARQDTAATCNATHMCVL